MRASGPENSVSINRRRLLIGAGRSGMALGAAAMATPAIARTRLGDPEPSPLFKLGVASGDPTSRSVVLWTRLVEDPFAADGGMNGKPTPVIVSVALDPGMRHVVRRGVQIAWPHNGYAINVQVSGLPSNSWLYYQFHAPKLGARSRIGRTRTFPGRYDAAGELKLAFASCQNYEAGFYTAYRDMLAQEVDCVIHCGDYIYENAGSSSPAIPGRVHQGDEIFSVADYRSRYAQYRLDPDLQDMHANAPFLVTWDDHEVDNNFAGNIAEEGAPFEGAEFLERKHNALRAYRETMPLRPWNRFFRGPELRIYRQLSFGSLANIYMLDTRQYRTDQPAEDGFGSTDMNAVLLEGPEGLNEKLFDEQITDPSATMLGKRQERWLSRRLHYSRARWNIMAQGIMVMRWNLAALGGGLVSDLLNVDAWDGYQAAQTRLLKLIAASGAQNPVVLTGDIHSSWGANLLSNYEDPASDAVAAEFVCTGISSSFGGDARETDGLVRATLPANPHIEYFEGKFRGYALCTVDLDSWTTEYRLLGESPSNPGSLLAFPDSPVSTAATLRLEAGFNVPGSGGRLQTL
ncbi:MAG: alkaline phosphatase D family protein [Pseudomonadota bacterium]